MNNENLTLSLYTCRKLLPIVNAAKIGGFLGTIFFQGYSVIWPVIVFGGFTVIMLTADTILKLKFWKCPSCRNVLPHDFYSRKTMTHCPKCKRMLNFEVQGFFVPMEALRPAEGEESEEES